MNIEKLNKDKSIIHLIAHLKSRFGLEKFVLNDFWDADLFAIGISDPQKEILIYISTYGKKKGEYFISIEDIDNPTSPIDLSEKVKMKKLEMKIAKYLKIEIVQKCVKRP